MPVDHYPIRLLVIAISVLLILGCASTFQPRPIEEVNFLARAQTKTQGNLRVTAVVLSAEESKAVFGVSLYKKSSNRSGSKSKIRTKTRSGFSLSVLIRTWMKPGIFSFKTYGIPRD